MRDPEFNTQILETDAQWRSGLGSGLNMDATGLSLFAVVSFESWLVSGSGRFGDIVTDQCGQTYWTATENGKDSSFWALFRLDPGTGQITRVIRLGGVKAIDPRRLWLTPCYLWILDKIGNRLIALARENFQLVFEVPVGADLIDADFDRESFFWSLEKYETAWRICRYSLPSATAGPTQCFPLKSAKTPAALALAPSGLIYIFDSSLGRFITFSPKETEDKNEQILDPGSKPDLRSKKPAAGGDEPPPVMEIDDRGVIFLVSQDNDPDADRVVALRQFSGDGTFLDKARLPAGITKISGIGFDRQRRVYLATDLGLARFSPAITPVGHTGVYYCRTLDNGQHEGAWHGLELRAVAPAKTSIDVYYYASDSTALKAAYDQVLSSDSATQRKVEQIENLLATLWKTPERFKGAASSESIEDTLFLDQGDRSTKGRYLWLKLALNTFDEKASPSIGSARISYPRLSYLRYLPLPYREEPMSAAFLERFLAMFETIFHGIETEIDGLFRYFDPESTPPEFLPWLASWIHLTFDEDLPLDRARQLIRRAPVLFSRKGTPGGLIEFLEIYTGRLVSLTEPVRQLAPMVLGAAETSLGKGTFLLASTPAGFRLGDTSVVGYSQLRDRASAPEDPFLPLLRRFTVTVDMDRNEFMERSATLRRIIEEQSPAHTLCALGLASGQGFVGTAQLGISATVNDAQPYRVGITPLGSGSALSDLPPALRIERGAWLGNAERL